VDAHLAEGDEVRGLLAVASKGGGEPDQLELLESVRVVGVDGRVAGGGIRDDPVVVRREGREVVDVRHLPGRSAVLARYVVDHSLLDQGLLGGAGLDGRRKEGPQGTNGIIDRTAPARKASFTKVLLPVL